MAKTAKSSSSSNLFAMIASLVGVSSLAALILGYTYELTAEPIRRAQAAQEQQAISAIIGTDFDNNPYQDKILIPSADKKSKLEFYPARRDGRIKAFAIKGNSNKAFGGNLELIVGFDINGRILGYKITKSQETPGLGSKVSEPRFAEQLLGLKPSSPMFKVKQDGGEIDAVTAATISSRAVLDAIKKAYDSYHNLKSGEKHE